MMTQKSAPRKADENIFGVRFERLLAVSEGTRNKFNQRTVFCRCDCGVEKDVVRYVLLHGITRSCGCLQRELAALAKKSHGERVGGRESPEWSCWKQMRDRCHRPNHGRYAAWGGRGIVVCERWRESFSAFLEDMGRRPSAEHSIDRINNDGPYEKSNCRWATRKEQGRNTRRNRLLEHNGKAAPLTEWAEISGIRYAVLSNRVRRGWSIADALTRPVESHERRPDDSVAPRGTA